jgi:hypothetical protein
VAEERFYNLLLDAETFHPGCCGSPRITNAPRLETHLIGVTAGFSSACIISSMLTFARDQPEIGV